MPGPTKHEEIYIIRQNNQTDHSISASSPPCPSPAHSSSTSSYNSTKHSPSPSRVYHMRTRRVIPSSPSRPSSAHTSFSANNDSIPMHNTPICLVAEAEVARPRGIPPVPNPYKKDVNLHPEEAMGPCNTAVRSHQANILPSSTNTGTGAQAGNGACGERGGAGASSEVRGSAEAGERRNVEDIYAVPTYTKAVDAITHPLLRDKGAGIGPGVGLGISTPLSDSYITRSSFRLPEKTNVSEKLKVRIPKVSPYAIPGVASPDRVRTQLRKPTQKIHSNTTIDRNHMNSAISGHSESRSDNYNSTTSGQHQHHQHHQQRGQQPPSSSPPPRGFALPAAHAAPPAPRLSPLAHTADLFLRLPSSVLILLVINAHNAYAGMGFAQNVHILTYLATYAREAVTMRQGCEQGLGAGHRMSEAAGRGGNGHEQGEAGDNGTGAGGAAGRMPDVTGLYHDIHQHTQKHSNNNSNTNKNGTNTNTGTSTGASAFHQGQELLLLLPVLTSNEVERRYKQLALRLHPDKCGHALATEAFHRLKAFSAQLSDVRTRYECDKQLWGKPTGMWKEFKECAYRGRMNNGGGDGDIDGVLEELVEFLRTEQTKSGAGGSDGNGNRLTSVGGSATKGENSMESIRTNESASNSGKYKPNAAISDGPGGKEEEERNKGMCARAQLIEEMVRKDNKRRQDEERMELEEQWARKQEEHQRRERLARDAAAYAHVHAKQVHTTDAYAHTHAHGVGGGVDGNSGGAGAGDVYNAYNSYGASHTHTTHTDVSAQTQTHVKNANIATSTATTTGTGISSTGTGTSEDTRARLEALWMRALARERDSIVPIAGTHTNNTAYMYTHTNNYTNIHGAGMGTGTPASFSGSATGSAHIKRRPQTASGVRAYHGGRPRPPSSNTSAPNSAPTGAAATSSGGSTGAPTPTPAPTPSRPHPPIPTRVHAPRPGWSASVAVPVQERHTLNSKKILSATEMPRWEPESYVHVHPEKRSRESLPNPDTVSDPGKPSTVRRPASAFGDRVSGFGTRASGKTKSILRPASAFGNSHSRSSHFSHSENPGSKIPSSTSSVAHNNADIHNNSNSNAVSPHPRPPRLQLPPSPTHGRVPVSPHNGSARTPASPAHADTRTNTYRSSHGGVHADTCGDACTYLDTRGHTHVNTRSPYPPSPSHAHTHTHAQTHTQTQTPISTPHGPILTFNDLRIRTHRASPRHAQNRLFSPHPPSPRVDVSNAPNTGTSTSAGAGVGVRAARPLLRPHTAHPSSSTISSHFHSSNTSATSSATSAPSATPSASPSAPALSLSSSCSQATATTTTATATTSAASPTGGTTGSAAHDVVADGTSAIRTGVNASAGVHGSANAGSSATGKNAHNTNRYASAGGDSVPGQGGGGGDSDDGGFSGRRGVSVDMLYAHTDAHAYPSTSTSAATSAATSTSASTSASTSSSPRRRQGHSMPSSHTSRTPHTPPAAPNSNPPFSSSSPPPQGALPSSTAYGAPPAPPKPVRPRISVAQRNIDAARDKSHQRLGAMLLGARGREYERLLAEEERARIEKQRQELVKEKRKQDMVRFRLATEMIQGKNRKK